MHCESSLLRYAQLRLIDVTCTKRRLIIVWVYRGFLRDITAAKSCKSRYSQPPCWIFFALSGIGKSHKICSHSLLLNLHKAKLHRSNNVINIYSLTASLTCSNKISKKLKHILLFYLGFSYTAPRKKISNMVSARSAHGVRTASWKPSIDRWQFISFIIQVVLLSYSIL